MHPVLSNRETLVAVILAGGLILASALAFGSVLHEPYAGVEAVEPSTLAGGSAAADVPSVAYLEGGHEWATLTADISSIRTATP